jgi:hypothetical protein
MKIAGKIFELLNNRGVCQYLRLNFAQTFGSGLPQETGLSSINSAGSKNNPTVRFSLRSCQPLRALLPVNLNNRLLVQAAQDADILHVSKIGGGQSIA